MMGSQKSADSLTALLAVISDPSKAKEALAQVEAATEAHKKAKVEAVKAKIEARQAAVEAESNAAVAVQNAREAERSAREQLNKVNSERNTFEAAKIAQNEAIKAHQAKIDADLVVYKEGSARLIVDKEEHKKAVQQHTEMVAKTKQEHLKKENEFSARENRLTSISAALHDREEKVVSAEANLSQRLQKMRELAA